MNGHQSTWRQTNRATANWPTNIGRLGDTFWSTGRHNMMLARVNGTSWWVTGFHYTSTRAVLTGARFPLAELTGRVDG